MLEYRTWILPTLIINGNIVARGYIPTIEMIQKYLVGENKENKYEQKV